MWHWAILPADGSLEKKPRCEEGLIRQEENGSGVKGQTGYSYPIPKAGIGSSPRFAVTRAGLFSRESIFARLLAPSVWTAPRAARRESKLYAAGKGA
jgi:hypothetical protein